jgi:hypothetical protein
MVFLQNKALNRKLMRRSVLMVLFAASFLAACSSTFQQGTPLNTSTVQTPVETLASIDNTEEPFFIPTEGPYTPAATVTPQDAAALWVSSAVPAELTAQLNFPLGVYLAGNADDSVFTLDVIVDGKLPPDAPQSTWIYVLVAPFPTIQDNIDSPDLQDIWLGNSDGKTTLLVSPSTVATFDRLWGTSSPQSVEIVNPDQMLDLAWSQTDTWAIIPFEQITPRWKVLAVDGISPLEKSFLAESYPLTVNYGITRTDGDKSNPVIFQAGPAPILPNTNRDADKLTVLVMTGTTALVRYTALRMEENGVEYPAGGIASWLQDADITHISNEVPFYNDCPPAKPVRVEARFCSDPSYFNLLKYIGMDIVELTGNHELDWGPDPFLATLDIYSKNDIPYFGGGKNLADARKTVLIEDHGNKLAFMGCSPAGPAPVWATANTPGSNPCDWDWIASEIDRVTKLGYIPIMTFQHIEMEDYAPHSAQRVDSLHASQLGAVIVSGSQSHFPQAMTFDGDHFIHYGLGNLFFDQMYGNNTQEFIDRHIFYNGQYINTELLTARLEDFARPRPMSQDERQEFLDIVFNACIW